MDLKVIAFDADDTLWVNEPYFKAIELKFCELLEGYMPQHSTARELLTTEIKNLPLYGYGIKGFILSMIETAIETTGKTIHVETVERIINFGKDLLTQPIELLDGVEEVLVALKDRYRLVVATKGDLLDQERKLRNSGIEYHFHHIEIMSDKRETDYLKLIKHLDIKPEEFLMIGNSIKSDVMPVLGINANAIHVPYHTNWAHEQVDHIIDHPRFKEAKTLRDVMSLL